MEALQNHDITCPYCGETNSLEIDCSSGSQDYIEDCQVCCRPINIFINIDDDDVQLHVAHENE
jgi:transposase-like protein